MWGHSESSFRSNSSGQSCCHLGFGSCSDCTSLSTVCYSVSFSLQPHTHAHTHTAPAKQEQAQRRNNSPASRKGIKKKDDGKGNEKGKTNDRMLRLRVSACVCVCACLDVGVAVALLSSLESVLIKKDWFYSKCVPEGSRLHCKHVLKQGSHEGNEVGLEAFKYCFPCTLLTKRVLDSNARRFFMCES